jgi:serine-type D-Ala-D-Ala carboxypeptidase (penicillin-binding protein 5/6)
MLAAGTKLGREFMIRQAGAVLAAALFLAFSLAATAQQAAAPPPGGFETKAGQAHLVDAATGTVLFSKDADRQVPPASLAKLMTMEVVFEAIRKGEVGLDTTYKVSENAWRTGGAPSRTSTMFAALNSEIRLEDLVQGVVVQQANDGCIVIAEGMAGSEAAFAARMNARAREIGLEGASFVNSTGLPAEGQSVTMRDLVTLAAHLWREHPDLYRFYAQRDFTWNKILQRNRNPLLAMDIGADGLATGFAEQSGYAIVGSAARGGRRLFVAMSGLASESERSVEARRLLEWGFDGFRTARLFADGETVGEVMLFGAPKRRLAVRTGAAVAMLLPVDPDAKVEARIVYDGPVEAPVAEGQPIGTLEVRIGGTLGRTVPVFAKESVERGTLRTRAYEAMRELLVGWMR